MLISPRTTASPQRRSPPCTLTGVLIAILSACSHPPTPTSATSVGVSPELEAIGGPPTTCSGERSTWNERPVGRDRLRFASGLDADADRAAAGIVAVRAGLADVLGVPSDATPPALVWLVTASPEITSGIAMTSSNSTSATVFLYSPSCDTDRRPQQFERSIAQELSGLYLRVAVERSPAGWSFYSSPSWFVQGSEEWVARQVHERPTDVVALASSRAKKPPEGAIQVEGGDVKVENDYRDGEALVAWLVLDRGPDVVDRLLASDAPSFQEALSEAAGLDGPGLVRSYLGWRSEHQ